MPPPTPQPPIPPVPPPPASAGGAVYGQPSPPLTGPPLQPARSGDGKRNLLGWLSLVFGVLGTGCCCCPWLNGLPFLGGIPAVVLGILHLQKVRKGEATHAWLGWVGIVLGAIALIGAILGLVTDWGDRLRTEYDNQF